MDEILSPSCMSPEDLRQFLQPGFDPEAKRRAVNEGRLLAKGLPVSPGVTSGRIKLHADDAEAWVHRYGKGNPEGRVILVREIKPEDIRGIMAATGILTATCDASSHTALVSQQLGKVCIVGCNVLNTDYAKGTISVEEKVLKEGDWLSIDGYSGEVFAGQLPIRTPDVIDVLLAKSMRPEQSIVYQQFAEIMSWADSHRKLRVRANADLPRQAEAAIAFGAEGIGLCRTEHMFFDHIEPMREMILARTPEQRRQALLQLLPYQKAQFAEMFRAVQGRPVAIRTLDPPLHEFLPHDAEGQREVAAKMGVEPEVIAECVKALYEFNPMLGFRGCRLGIVYPEITAMQCRAIFEAASKVHREGTPVEPEIMIPMMSWPAELRAQARIVHETAKDVFQETGVVIRYLVGAMIELPRACLVADKIAQEAQFFTFSTNDLTQTCLGMSRDDYGNFIRHYTQHGILSRDPFQTIDQDGVGALIRLAVERGRAMRPDLKIGICGEHGSDPDTIRFCHDIGLDYVSAAPFRVPTARLAAGQAAFHTKGVASGA